jgi:hypothetical protein
LEIMTFKQQFQRIKKIETEINRNLFIACAVVTIVAMAMLLLEFFTRGAFPTAQISLFYLGVLLLYSLHKEMVRWLGQRQVERQGEYFVYAWIILTTTLYIVNFFAKDLYSCSAAGEPLDTLEKISVITLEVLAIFILTRILKILKICLTRNQFFKKIKESD